jgi:UDP-3-O-[3-hydroxymyristoyl] N-acetylglucosamine deacetylase / 3-hydroxyacyl-[acyl-carrier-protein] dehydratase
MIGSTQRTVAGPVEVSGVGVHSGETARLVIRPDAASRGIRFVRTDLPDADEIPADLDHVVATELGTSLGTDDTNRVLTVEHLLAALAAAGVHAARIEIDGPEPPILDGSFLPWLDAIEAVGTTELDAPVPVLRVRRALHLDAGDGTTYMVAPAEGFALDTTIEFDHPAVGRQMGGWELTPERFREAIAPARTFGFAPEAEVLRARGRALGSSLENTVVLDETGVLNPEGLRFPDEFVRHKAGDVVGDLALLGMRIEGRIVAHRPSHRGNVELARLLAVEARRDPEGEPIVDAARIMEYLPHRYPMLLVDRVTHFEAGKRITGLKNVTINEPFFQGHYPGHPIMPGVLIIEAMAQVGGLLLMDTIERPDDKVVYFMSLDNVKWRRPVTPGDQLVFELELLQFRRGICRMRGEAWVAGRLVAEAELMARVVDR